MQSLPYALPGFRVTKVISTRERLVISASSQSRQATCPTCQTISNRIHSYYTRSPADLPSSGRLVQLVLQVRRFRCQNPACHKHTFAERLHALPAWARQTSCLATILESIAVVLSGEAGSRLARQFGMPVSADSLLRRAQKPPLTAPSTPKVLGVDDFAFRRGHTYGTLLINLETHRPVDLLPDRSAETFAEWLRQHPGVEIISRDRSKDYQRGARDGAPAAKQVIDRWHVLKNLREAIERFLSHTQIPNTRGLQTSVQNALRQKRTSGERTRSEGARRRRLALYQQVHDLYQQGGTILGIARQLKIGHQTVRNFVQSPSYPEWGKPARTRSAIDPYRAYLQERWQQGCRSTPQLWHEVQARGFTGSRMMVYRWVQLQSDGSAATPVHKQDQEPRPVKSLAPRHLAWLFLCTPTCLEKEEQETLSLLLKAEPIKMAYTLAQRLVTMIKERNAQALDTWLLDCQHSGISDLVTFAQGLEKEGSAFHAGLTLPYSTGPVEGKINKLKYIKRSMYGRSAFPLLRQKVLKAG